MFSDMCKGLETDWSQIRETSRILLKWGCFENRWSRNEWKESCSRLSDPKEGNTTKGNATVIILRTTSAYDKTVNTNFNFKGFNDLHGNKSSRRDDIPSNTDSRQEKEKEKNVKVKDTKNGATDTQASNKGSEKINKKEESSKYSEVEAVSDTSGKEEEETSKTSTKKNRSQSTV